MGLPKKKEVQQGLPEPSFLVEQVLYTIPKKYVQRSVLAEKEKLKLK